MRALNLLRPQVVYRRDAFNAGLSSAGYVVVTALPDPQPGDVVICWNRYAWYDEQARRFEAAGAIVVVAENGYLPDIGGERWLALAIGHHAGAGKWHCGGPERWDDLGIELLPWRYVNGGRPLILGQRGIGEPGIASPVGWAEAMQRKIGGRIRPHPGRHAPKPMIDDLADASCVVTWASSAAFQALMWGVPVWYEMSKWIGAGACRQLLPLAEMVSEPMRDDTARLAMFRRLIWAQWSMREIESGAAFRHLLC